MVLFKLWEVPREGTFDPKLPDCFRWTFQVNRYQNQFGFSIGFEQQYRDPKTKEWQENNNVAILSLTDHFALGPEHMWYDGPHCMFSIGCLHFCWTTNYECKKCNVQ